MMIEHKLSRSCKQLSLEITRREREMMLKALKTKMLTSGRSANKKESRSVKHILTVRSKTKWKINYSEEVKVPWSL
jgi:hypothetical protein